MKTLIHPFIVFAVNSNAPKISITAHRLIERSKEVTGSYTDRQGKQVTETSYLMPVNSQSPDQTIINHASNLHILENQESILYVAPDSSAYLVYGCYTDQRAVQYVGQWRETCQAHAEKQTGYTVIDNRYYIAA
jgi:beta-xylosidase